MAEQTWHSIRAMRTVQLALAAFILTTPATLQAQGGGDEILSSRKDHIADTRQAFKLLDWNKDGFVTLDEMERLVIYGATVDAPPGSKPSEQELAETRSLFKAMDANGDKKISRREMMRWTLRGFDCLDENHDGKLTESESNRNEQRCADIPAR